MPLKDRQKKSARITLDFLPLREPFGEVEEGCSIVDSEREIVVSPTGKAFKGLMDSQPHHLPGAKVKNTISLHPFQT